MLSPQALAQGAFLRAEALFNRLFGERLNPFYYLGAIAWLHLWIVVASGLYLYAFFETSVTGAHESLEPSTRTQPWAGGLMRSLHRYASDGMVLAMLLHLARHFTFGHHRGFRWFSWVSGVALLWLVYVSGINGYMLPWDQLSQFVVVVDHRVVRRAADLQRHAHAQLPRATRRSATACSRCCRSCTSGCRSRVLALLWIHTQRVPKAADDAARADHGGRHHDARGALHRHAGGEPGAGGSRHGDAVASPRLVLPAAAAAHLRVGRGRDLGGRGRLHGPDAGPALDRRAPPGRLGAAAFAISVHPDERIVTARGGETMLEAGLREGLPMPFDCRNGGCGVCKGELLRGEVRLRPYQESRAQRERARRGQDAASAAPSRSPISRSTTCRARRAAGAGAPATGRA